MFYYVFNGIGEIVFYIKTIRLYIQINIMFVSKNVLKSFLSYVQKTNFSTLSEYKNKKVKIKDRDARHYAPANKEWKNSVYAFNKADILNIGAKDKKVASIIKSYFNMVPKPLYITKSKRMRDLLRRSSTRQLFVSKPEIKQNNDKAIITVYTHDREKVLYLKKLFMLNRWLNTSVANLERLDKDRKKSDKSLVSKYNVDFLLKKRVFNKRRRITFRKTRNYLRRSLNKYQIKRDFFKKISISLLRKRQFIVTIMFHYFLTWALSLFKIRINIVPIVLTKIKKNKELKNKKNKKNKISETITIRKYFLDLILTGVKKGRKRRNDKITFNKKITLKGKFDMETLIKLNTLLLQHLMINVNSILKVKQKIKIYALFNIFRKKYFNAIARRHLRKEVLIIKYLTKLSLNKFKFHIYLPGLKNLLSGLYDKKIQLNIVNLKYLHLNSDLYSEAISIKLRKRTTGLLRVLRKSFKLVKTFKANDMFLLSEKEKNSLSGDLKTYFGKYNVVNGNVLNLAFKEMFSKYVVRNMLKHNTTVKNTLTSLKYKWITGLRVEAAGRLTKRYAAARAVYKYKYKGTLKNLEHLKNIENNLNSPSLFLLRGQARPNTQYSFVPSKRRIGAFGIKSWISNS